MTPMAVPLEHYLVLSAILFVLGTAGVLTRRNGLIMFMSIELMLNAVNLTLVAYSRFLGDMTGHVLVIMVMTVAAAEAAVGLAIIWAIFRNRTTVNIDELTLMKG
jgi:NADH-quinone oxidoreductase subunit K